MILIHPRVVLGLDPSRLQQSEAFACQLLPEVLAELALLAAAAKDAGFDLRVASSYRSFARQLLIWNAKAQGLRPVLDSAGQEIDISPLTEVELMWAILRWSALPGASRHHWGTDLDVYDCSRMAPDFQLLLTQAECTGDGPCADFHRWLTAELGSGRWAFYRPYDKDRGGVATEPWHLSYEPIANQCAQLLTLELLAAQIAASDIQLKAAILANLPEIYRRFVRLD